MSNLLDIKIKQLMTRSLFTVDVNDSISKSAEIIWKNRVHSVLVTKNGRLHGIITSLDLINVLLIEKAENNLFDSDDYQIPSVSFLKIFMTNNKSKELIDILNMPVKNLIEDQFLVTIKPEDTLKTAVELMKRGRFLHIPVTDSGKLVGIISSKDIIDYLNIIS